MDKICKICLISKDLSSFKVSKKTNKPLNPCFECIKQRKSAERSLNVKRDNAAKRAWAERNKNKVKIARDKYKKNNIAKVKLSKTSRRNQILLATPKWLSPIQLEAINFYHMMADLRTKTSGVQYHVDHIIPIKGKQVCGLNVPWNLEVITAKENLSKGNIVYPHRERC